MKNFLTSIMTCVFVLFSLNVKATDVINIDYADIEPDLFCTITAKQIIQAITDANNNVPLALSRNIRLAPYAGKLELWQLEALDYNYAVIADYVYETGYYLGEDVSDKETWFKEMCLG